MRPRYRGLFGKNTLDSAINPYNLPAVKQSVSVEH
jgi:hypothetical protein